MRTSKSSPRHAELDSVSPCFQKIADHVRNDERAINGVFRSPLMIRAIFFDIDGTLVSFNTQKMLQSTKTAVIKLRQKGIKVFIATGRTVGEMNNLDDLEFDGYITANGAYCVDSQGKVIDSHRISTASLERLACDLDRNPFPCVFVTEKGNFINYADEMMIHIRQIVNLPIPPVMPVNEIIKHEIFQLDAYMDAARENELLAHVLPDCMACRWHPYFADINPKRCSKATGMEQFLAYFGIEREHTMAFGDGGNDISMIKHAAIGVAMGNAQDEVKAAADYVTDSVEADGIVKALRYFELL